MRSPLTHDTMVQSEGSGPLRHGDGTGGSQAGDRILEKMAGPDERVHDRRPTLKTRQGTTQRPKGWRDQDATTKQTLSPAVIHGTGQVIKPGQPLNAELISNTECS